MNILISKRNCHYVFTNGDCFIVRSKQKQLNMFVEYNTKIGNCCCDLHSRDYFCRMSEFYYSALIYFLIMDSSPEYFMWYIF